MNLKTTIPTILLCIGAICLIATPPEQYSAPLWLASLVGSKLISVICFAAYSKMRQTERT